ncbi:hypothetical protein DGMP_22610 [Desulfomarina profundi]|uniref:Protein TonB n=1 Tax=Desulfomarina profundi TaxID=2772557 RepID=A0A8D5FM57_9BACT|nr:energy transducer TonB [Desulfomarina profundi]BCL61568.1 hypothetical protein DGMP_22610 [Desulfomarina profundi]
MKRFNRKMPLQSNTTTWILSVLSALFLNMFFFLGIPNLVHDKGSPHTIESMVSGVQFLRLKPHEQPPPPQKKKKKEPEKKPKKKKAVPRHNRAVVQNLTLPFQLNPRLPAGPSSLELPPLKSSSSLNPGDIPKVFQVGQLDSSLTPLVRIPPMYPMRARRRGIEGWVKVKFIVNNRGNVTNIVILKAQPERIFNEAVRRCLRQWRFRPGTVGGIVVDAEITTTIRFKLE